MAGAVRGSWQRSVFTVSLGPAATICEYLGPFGFIIEKRPIIERFRGTIIESAQFASVFCQHECVPIETTQIHYHRAQH